ncbi:hypothetical protein GKZ89_01625 [Bacillus mangrovi]|uniref:Kazal-like domain-containing protein n=1 Tax=Metabacillus mangrovi TaxID=1491830 RepID=A0A7X2S2P6_9BACI|nr:hypothetical protein [Metabacillus mangrovi]
MCVCRCRAYGPVCGSLNSYYTAKCIFAELQKMEMVR